MWGYYTIDKAQNDSQNGSSQDNYKRIDLEVQQDGQQEFQLPPPLVPNSALLFINGLKLTIAKDFTFSNTGLLRVFPNNFLETTDQIEITYL